MAAPAPAIEMIGVTKAFGALVANDRVDLRVESGTIHGVIGENGAGKSTAMKILYGLYRADSGELRVRGEPKRWETPHDAIRAGIGMVHQHFMLAGPSTALDNILLGAEPVRGPRAFGLIDRAGARKRLTELSAQYGLPVPLDTPVEELPVGIQQRIEILKLLYRNAEILILDEPTAVLTPQEIQDLFANLKKLRGEGKTIIVITHKLREVLALTDRVTVFRAGKVTGEVETAKVTAQDLADRMVGRKVVLHVEVPPQPELGQAALEVSELTLQGASRPRLDRVSLSIRGGEVLGIAGVEGNGQSELLQALFHPADPLCRTSGRVRILGRDATELSTAEIKAMGVGLIPEDRHREGLMLDRPVAENFLMGHQRELSRYGFINSGELGQAASQALEEHDVRPRRLDVLAGGLSGGNQQKLIIAREFFRKPRLLVAAQPTRGVDVGAIEAIHRRILAARTEGSAVLLVSSELDEILSLSDRILVLFEGRIAGEFKRGQASERELGLAMGGGAHAH